MDDLRRLHPGKAFVYSVGDSVKGTPLWVIAVAARKPESHVTLRPELKFVGNMHGNEVVGRELIIRFARHLLDNYGVLENVTKLVNHSRIHLMPTMNPDGFDAAIMGECTGVTGRANAKDMDLNRNFPDAFDSSHSPQRQKETQLVMDWAMTTQFVLSANMHGGALVANYPFDNYANSDGYTARYSISPDDALFRKMAYTYSKYNLPMKKSAEFESGVTNGAQWYPLPGGMQDWMYLKGGCMELTLEVSDCKYPLYEQIDGFWNDNRDSMLSFLYKGFIGVKGIVKDANNNPLSDVRVSVVGRGEVVSRTTPSGEFWRLLLPGRHSLKFKSGNSGATFVNLTLPEFEDFDPNAAVIIDVVLGGDAAVTVSETTPATESVTEKITPVSVVGTEEVGTITMPENSAVEVFPRKQYLSGMIVIIFLIIRI